jgi:transposase
MGQTPIIQELFTGHQKTRYSMLAACDYNGFIKECCQIVLRVEEGTVNTDRFVQWIEERLVPLLGDYGRMEAISVVVLDNASIRHDDRVVEAIEAAGARVLYTAPYSPDLNPIEWMFAQYKSSLKKPSNKMSHWEAHILGLYCVSATNARNYFRRCGVPGCDSFGDSEKENDHQEATAAAAVAAFVAVYVSKPK